MFPRRVPLGRRWGRIGIEAVGEQEEAPLDFLSLMLDAGDGHGRCALAREEKQGQKQPAGRGGTRAARAES